MIGLILDTAADILQTDGWTNNPNVGAWRRPEPKCVAFAIEAAGVRLLGNDREQEVVDAFDAFAKFIPHKPGFDGGLEAIVHWSDVVCTSTEEAVDKLRAAARMVRERELVTA